MAALCARRHAISYQDGLGRLTESARLADLLVVMGGYTARDMDSQFYWRRFSRRAISYQDDRGGLSKPDLLANLQPLQCSTYGGSHALANS